MGDLYVHVNLPGCNPAFFDNEHQPHLGLADGVTSTGHGASFCSIRFIRIASIDTTAWHSESKGPSGVYLPNHGKFGVQYYRMAATLPQEIYNMFYFQRIVERQVCIKKPLGWFFFRRGGVRDGVVFDAFFWNKKLVLIFSVNFNSGLGPMTNWYTNKNRIWKRKNIPLPHPLLRYPCWNFHTVRSKI